MEGSRHKTAATPNPVLGEFVPIPMRFVAELTTKALASPFVSTRKSESVLFSLIVKSPLGVSNAKLPAVVTDKLATLVTVPLDSL